MTVAAVIVGEVVAAFGHYFREVVVVGKTGASTAVVAIAGTF